jgi:hypothetical protein
MEAHRAVQGIGTNALPFLLEWFPCESPAWRTTLHYQLRKWLRQRLKEYPLARPETDQRAENGFCRIMVLGTNAVTAIPGLEALLKHHTKPWIASRATIALTFVGKPAIPVLKRALADVTQFNRSEIVGSLETMAEYGDAKVCLPILAASLGNEDHSIREAATNALLKVAPELLPPHQPTGVP